MKKQKLAIATAVILSSVSPTSSFAAKVTRLEPSRCISLVEHLGRLLSTTDDIDPVIHEIEIPASVVEQHMPTQLTARLQREAVTTGDKIANAARDRRVMDPFKKLVRKHSEDLGDIPDAELVNRLVPENQAHTFAVAVGKNDKGYVSFSPTGPNSIDDQWSKHAMVTHDLDNTRGSGLLWRDGKDEATGKPKLCFNINSGTFMKAKKRAEAGLEKPPEPTAILPVLQTAFAGAIVAYCGEPDIKIPHSIPPGYTEFETARAAEKARENILKDALDAAKKPPKGMVLQPEGIVLSPEFKKQINLLTEDQFASLPHGTQLVGLDEKPFIVGQGSLEAIHEAIKPHGIRERLSAVEVPSGFVPVGYKVRNPAKKAETKAPSGSSAE